MFQTITKTLGRSVGRTLGKTFGRIVDLGVTVSQPAPLKKRIRLSNGVSLFGAFVLLASIPFDLVEAPPWMVVEDVIGGLAYLGFPLLNRWGRLTLSRLLCIALSNLIVLGNAVFLGRDSGAQMVFIALTAIPFAFFDLRERIPLVFGVALSVVCFVAAHVGPLANLQSVSENFSPAHYYVYSAAVAFVALLFSLIQTGIANARAEDALRNDIQKREQAEKELELTRQTSIHSAKMAALGEMSGNIAHEVNNPLAAILLRAQRLRRLVAKDSVDMAAVDKAAGDIESTVHRIRRIVDALRSFARDGAQDPMRPERVQQIVQDTVEICAQRFKHHSIDLRIDAIPDDLFVECRGIQISQILLNLLSNAHDAVETREHPWVRLATEVDAGQVRIVVTDSGPGIPPELEPRIMSPFFTTKDAGKGTGLGLSVSRGIAEAHSGRLEYDAHSPDTRFVLTLNRTAAPAEPKAAAPPGA